MAKKKESRADQVRAAVEQAFEATTHGASPVRERAQELAEARRGRVALPRGDRGAAPAVAATSSMRCARASTRSSARSPSSRPGRPSRGPRSLARPSATTGRATAAPRAPRARARRPAPRPPSAAPRPRARRPPAAPDRPRAHPAHGPRAAHRAPGGVPMTLTCAWRGVPMTRRRPDSGWLDSTRKVPPRRGRAPPASSRAVPASGGISTGVPPLSPMGRRVSARAPRRADVARRVGVTAPTLRRWIASGLVPADGDGAMTAASVAHARVGRAAARARPLAGRDPRGDRERPARLELHRGPAARRARDLDAASRPRARPAWSPR